jgi:peptidoglycan hydrolase-like protein with peptidoglycan-binding domain
MRYREFKETLATGLLKSIGANPTDATTTNPVANNTAGKIKLDVPAGRMGPGVADVQKALTGLGYDIGSTGVDGVRGPFTSSAIKQFQTDNQLTVDGDPGTETIAALNQAIAAKGVTFAKSTAADVKPRAGGSGNTQGASLPPLSTDSATTGKVGGVLNFLARYESGGNYNVILGGGTAPLTTMTIAQVFALQAQMRASGKESSAVGRYQYVGPTLREMVQLMGLDPNTTKFDAKTQDAIAITDMRRRCGLDDWLSGKLPDDQFLNKLSRVWASIPNTTTGGSFYAGVGSNKAGTKVDVALNTLQDIKTA